MLKRLLIIFVFLFVVAEVSAAPTRYTLEFGPEETVFDFSRDSCIQTESRTSDFPDVPTRTLVDKDGYVQLYISNRVTRKNVGANLSDTIHQCPIIFNSHYDSNPRKYSAAEFSMSLYTTNGNIIYDLIHNEFHGEEFNNCAMIGTTPVEQKNNCWWTSINLAKSTNAGKSFENLSPQNHNVANTALSFNPRNTFGEHGFFRVSNIVKKDNYYYSLIDVRIGQEKPPLPNHDKTCIMRTNNLDDPSSWKLWSGSAWNSSTKQFPNSGDCKSISAYPFDMHWNDYLQQYVSFQGATFYSSPNLTDWKQNLVKSSYNPLVKGDKPSAYRVVIQPGAETRNFEDTSRSPWVYYVSCGSENSQCRRQYGLDIWGGINRDVKRRRIRISKPEDVGKYDVLDLRFNEYKGTKTLDSSFYTNDGALNGNVKFVQNGGHNFVSFISNPGIITIPHSESLNLKKDMTISATIRTSQVPTKFTPILLKQNGDLRNYALILNKKGQLHFSIGTGEGVISKKSINDGQWHTIQISYSKTTRKTTYVIDNKFDSQSTQPGSLSDGVNNGPLGIGNNKFIGDIDRITIYNYKR